MLSERTAFAANTSAVMQDKEFEEYWQQSVVHRSYWTEVEEACGVAFPLPLLVINIILSCIQENLTTKRLSFGVDYTKEQ